MRYNVGWSYATWPGKKNIGDGAAHSIDSYKEFNQTLAWMRGLCGNTRIVLNQRRNQSATAQSMKRSWGGSGDTANLLQKVRWFDQYHEQEKVRLQHTAWYQHARKHQTFSACCPTRNFALSHMKRRLNGHPVWLLLCKHTQAGKQVIRVYYEDIASKPNEVAQVLRDFTGRKGDINFRRIPMWRRK